MNGFLFVSAYLNVCYLYGFQIYVVDYQKRHNGRENNQSYTVIKAIHLGEMCK